MCTHGLIMYRHVIGSLAGPGQFLDNCRVFATPNNGRTPRGGCGEGPPDSHSEPRARGGRLEAFGSVRTDLHLRSEIESGVIRRTQVRTSSTVKSRMPAFACK